MRSSVAQPVILWQIMDITKHLSLLMWLIFQTFIELVLQMLQLLTKDIDLPVPVELKQYFPTLQYHYDGSPTYNKANGFCFLPKCLTKFSEKSALEEENYVIKKL